MEIKRTQPGQANWNRTTESGASSKPPSSADPGLGAADGSPAFQSIRAEFRRADLGTDRWHAILSRSIDALLDTTAERFGALPSSAREKLSALLSADPLFSKRVMSYWDQNLN